MSVDGRSTVSAAGEPRTVAGRDLLRNWPATMTQQTCCDFPHGENSEEYYVFPPHKRTTETRVNESWRQAILAIEDEARRAFLDELIVTGTVAPMMSYNELKDVTDRLIARMQESFREADHA